jgi:hypothetical protein
MATKTAKKTVTKTKTSPAEPKVVVNGSYEFLVGHFKEPSTIIDAATALAGHSKIDPQIAVKKVEQFLENAKIDQALEVRAGTGGNDGQYLIARVPQGAQRKNGGREVKKATEKKATEKKATEKKATGETQHEAVFAALKTFHTIKDVLPIVMASPAFVGRTEKRVLQKIHWVLGAKKLQKKLGYLLKKREEGTKGTEYCCSKA